MAHANYNSKPMTTVNWFITLFILTIPLINIIMFVYWAMSSTGNVNRRNFCRASILWFVIMMVLTFVVLRMTGLIGVLLGQA